MNPFVSLLPRYLFASALVTQLVAVVIRLSAMRDIARGVLGAALLVGLVALCVLLVDYTTAPVGSRAHRIRGLASAWTSVLVVGFTMAWYLSDYLGPAPVFAVELVSFAGGAFGYWDSLRQIPELDENESDEDLTAYDHGEAGWPFPAVRADQPSVPTASAPSA